MLEVGSTCLFLSLLPPSLRATPLKLVKQSQPLQRTAARAAAAASDAEASTAVATRCDDGRHCAITAAAPWEGDTQVAAGAATTPWAGDAQVAATAWSGGHKTRTKAVVGGKEEGDRRRRR